MWEPEGRSLRSEKVRSDAQANLAAAIRVAAMPRSEIAGVSVVLNDEVHSPRTVTKSHTLRLNAFQYHGTAPSVLWMARMSTSCGGIEAQVKGVSQQISCAGFLVSILPIVISALTVL